MTYVRRADRKKSTPTPSKGFAFFLVGVGVLLVGAVGFYLTAAHMEENDQFCASCHSEPESTYFQRSQAAAASDLATAHHAKSVRCIDCHSGPGLTGRIGAMTIGAEDLLRQVTGQARQPAPLLVPISDANCLKCHSEVPQTQNFNQHFHAFLSRWQQRDKNAATCVSCHSAHTTDGTVGLQWLQKERTLNVCQSCHAALGEG